jgi:hypothetical protein
MTAKVILLSNQNNTEMPVVESDQTYTIELEQENLELRDALASAVLQARRGYSGTVIGFAVLLAFGVGWLLDPPFHIFGQERASAAATESPADEAYSNARRYRRALGEPRLVERAAIYELAI